MTVNTGDAAVRPDVMVRRVESEDRIVLSSVGVDIGSATSHLVFSKITLEKVGTRYVTVDREVLYESDILLTPYSGPDEIDSGELTRFVADQYAAAGVDRADVETGALILTGVALSRGNSRRIADVFAAEAGRMVAVSAGDSMESVMSAFGSGAAQRSESLDGGLLHIDIGGGTTKLALCVEGNVRGTLAVDAGARLIVTDPAGAVQRVEAAGRRIGERLGIDLSPGRQLATEEMSRLASHMVDEILGAARLAGRTPGELLRGEPLPEHQVGTVSFAGGVAEYVYGRQRQTFGDLGQPMARAILARVTDASVTILDTANGGIRATVVGASQYTVQVSGSTIHLSQPDVLPLRNVPIVAPPFDFADLDAVQVAASLQTSVTQFELDQRPGPIGVSFDWAGLATYARLDAFARGLSEGLAGRPDVTSPLVLVSSQDVGRLVGTHLTRDVGEPRPIVSIDCVDVGDFEFVDVGEVLDGAAVVPVVIKTLVFPPASRDRTATTA